MSRLSQQGRRKWRSRVAKERARARAGRIMAKYFCAYRDAALALYDARAGKSIFAGLVKPLAAANGFQKVVRKGEFDSFIIDEAEHVPATGAQIHAESERVKVSQLQNAIAPGEQCDRCSAGPPLFEHIYTDCTMRFCSRCKADAIDEDNDHDS